jgi:hypothetical protein
VKSCFHKRRNENAGNAEGQSSQRFVQTQSFSKPHFRILHRTYDDSF